VFRLPSFLFPLRRGFRRASIRRRLLALGRRAGFVTAHLASVALLLSVPGPAFAAPSEPGPPAKNLHDVISSLQVWVLGLLLALATLFAVLAGVYWATAGGDPTQIDKAKGALRNALIGYAIAVLAPVLLEAVKNIVGGP
jgi:hypothetical protein